jgi:hypothetical protein
MSDHYREGFSSQLEVIEILKDKLTPEQFIGFCLGNIIKYSLRANFKESLIKDIKKTKDYGVILDEFINTLAVENAGPTTDKLRSEEVSFDCPV